MSQTTTSSDECGCCEGIVPLTPVGLWNKPGLSSLRYRVGTYAKFRETMIARLGTFQLKDKATAQKFAPLSRLTTRADDDLAVGILDSWAVVGDVLTFYQERIANEGFLRTATERLSLLQLAREIGYELRPGVAASAQLAFTIDTSGSVRSTLVDVGTKVQSIPAEGKTPPEMPQTYETIEPILARPEFNSIRPRLTKVQQLDPTSLTQIVFQGTDTRLKVGDHLLLLTVSGSTSAPAAVATVSGVSSDSVSQTTAVLVKDVAQIGATPWKVLPMVQFIYAQRLLSLDVLRVGDVFMQRRSVAASISDDLSELDLPSVRTIISTYATQSALTAFLSDKGWDPQAFADVVNSFAEDLSPAPGIDVLALRITAGFFGDTAPAYATLTPSLVAAYPVDWDSDPHVAINTDSQGSPYDGGSVVYLDNAYPAVLAGSWAVIRSSNGASAYSVTKAESKSLADFVLTAKVTGLTLSVDGPQENPLPLYRLNNGKDHFYTLSEVERDKAISAYGYTAEGITGYAYPSPVQGVVPLYRMYNSADGDHFYTASLSESDNAITNDGYVSEGVNGFACYVFAADPHTQGVVPLYRLYNPTTGDHFYTTSAAERDNAIANYGYNDEHTACFVYNSGAADRTALYRLYSPATGDHFYTVSTAERDNAVKTYGYNDEGIACYVYGSWATPLFRLNNGTDHFYTASATERASAIAASGYASEGIACYVYPSDPKLRWSTPLYRLYNPTTGDHFYTTSASERDNAIANYGYNDEHTACYLFAIFPSELSAFRVRDTTAYAQSEKLQLAAIEDATSVQSASIVLDKVYAGLQVGQSILVAGELASQHGLTASEIVAITDITPFFGQPPATRIAISPALANSYDPTTITINANVAPATHGETKSGPIGSGDPPSPYLDFTLPQKPLTYIHAATPSGTKTTLEVRVDGLLWKEASSLYGLAPDSQSYIVRRDDDGTTHVLFGSARPAAGVENIAAKYRVGIGTPGMVKAGQLSTLMTKPLGVRDVTNPFDATGAADPEDTGHARVDAPLTVLTLDRIVSLLDVQDFALAFAGIGKALALWHWNGDRRVVRLIIASAVGTAVDKSSDLYKSLSDAIASFKDPTLDVSIDPSFAQVPFNVSGWVLVKWEYDSDTVRDAVVSALRARFSFEKGELGHPVHLSDVIGTIQLVDGVEAADLDEFYLSGQASQPNDVLTCDVTELLVLNSGSDGITLDMRRASQ